MELIQATGEIAAREIQLITSFTMDQMSPIGYAKNVRVPTFIIQVHDDALTKPSDVQQIFDNIPVNDKKLFWIKPLVCAPPVLARTKNR